MIILNETSDTIGHYTNLFLINNGPVVFDCIAQLFNCFRCLRQLATPSPFRVTIATALPGCDVSVRKPIMHLVAHRRARFNPNSMTPSSVLVTRHRFRLVDTRKWRAEELGKNTKEESSFVCGEEDWMWSGAVENV